MQKKTILQNASTAKDKIYSKLGVSADKDFLPQGEESHPTLDARTIIVFIVSMILLTVFYYYGKSSVFGQYLRTPIEKYLNVDSLPHASLISYIYWAVSSLFIRVLVPLLVIFLILKEKPESFGYRMPEKGHWKLYVLLFVFMLPLVGYASTLSSFQAKYPFFHDATKSWQYFFIYESTYVAQFIGVEAFFRGFLLFGLAKKLGYYSIFIMTIPYCMIHFGKPELETFGAIIAGIALGYLALETRSWLPGAALHAGVGITMDVLATLQG